MLIPRVRFSLALAGAALLLAACDSGGGDRAAIRAEDLAEYVSTLASDDFEGRNPAQTGGPKTVAYLTEQFKRIGLKPVNGSYVQDVELVEATAMPSSRIAVVTPTGERELTRGTEAVFWTKRLTNRIDITGSELVFAGYGVVAPELNWNDYAGVDVKGKTAVVLINDPDFETDAHQLFRGKAMTYYGRWSYKYEEAARQGAAAVLIVHETAPAAYPWAVVQNSNNGAKIDLVTADRGMSRLQLEGWITHDVATELFKAAGQDYAALKEAAKLPGFKPVPLPGLALNAGIDNMTRGFRSQNVVGLVEGSRAPDEYVLYMAHWDHLGYDNRIAEGEDRIYNGAVDNASGTAVLLELAEAFAMNPAPERSVMFVSVTAEESGLLGSLHFAQDPPVPLRQIAGGFNFDAQNPMSPARDITIIGFGASELEDIYADEAKKDGRILSPDPRPEWGLFYRSDHVNLAKAGVPMLYPDPGLDLVSGGLEAGRAVLEKYNVDDYHKPSDEYAPDWDFSGIVADTALVYRTGLRLANSTLWPNWYAGNEFRAIRDASRAGP